jgi:hypothetical protein
MEEVWKYMLTSALNINPKDHSVDKEDRLTMIK